MPPLCYILLFIARGSADRDYSIPDPHLTGFKFTRKEKNLN